MSKDNSPADNYVIRIIKPDRKIRNLKQFCEDPEIWMAEPIIREYKMSELKTYTSISSFIDDDNMAETLSLIEELFSVDFEPYHLARIYRLSIGYSGQKRLPEHNVVLILGEIISLLNKDEFALFREIKE
jgi:hypothetical protein